MLIESIIFYILFVIMFMSSELVLLVNMLYFVQLEGYSFLSPFKYLKYYFKKYIIFWLFYFVVSIVFVIFNVTNIYILTLYILFCCFIILYLSHENFSKNKLVFTKRLLRILWVLFLIVSSICILCCFFVLKNWNSYLYPLIVIINSFLVFLSLCILLPIEKIIGQYYIRKAKIKLKNNKKLIKVGITGSYGKTSVKEILSSILNRQYCILSTPKSYNTPFGITKTINNNLSNSHEIFVCEMGAKRKDEIKELCELVNIDMGVITAVGHQHTNTFGGIEKVYQTKKEMSDYLFNKECVFNLMNKYVYKMYKDYIGTNYGVYFLRNHNLFISNVVIKKKIDVILNIKQKNYKCLHEFPIKNCYYAKKVKSNENGLIFDVYSSGEYIFKIESNLIGEHNVINILLAIAISKNLNVSNRNIKLGVKELKNINARLEKFVTKNGAVVINNGYNSNLDSARSVIKVLDVFDKNHKIIVTPGLIETENDFMYNRKFGEMISKHCTEVIIVKEKNRAAILSGLSENCYDMDKVYYVRNFDEARVVIEKASEDCVFLIENDLPDNYK